MTKAEFCKILTKLKNVSDFENDIWKACYKYSTENKTDVNIFGTGLGLEADVIDLLSIIMNDKERDIEYFCYELDFGQAWQSGMITDKYGKDIDLSTPEKLYDWIMEGNK
ncbi:MAG: hypothetical protein J6X45_04460 [Lachnospiraceae bacterium]|nr:hypothetical protein [Lachnospiraceae bacterium]